MIATTTRICDRSVADARKHFDISEIRYLYLHVFIKIQRATQYTGIAEGLPKFSGSLPGISQGLPGISGGLPGISGGLPGIS